jgi:altronate hydrolase
MPSLIVRLDTADNIVIAVDEIAAGVVIPSEGISTRDLIPAGHKLATSIIRAGEPILKYNTVIGYAADNIPAGSHVHSHNIQFDNVEKNYALGQHYVKTDYVPESERATFMGYRRADGQIGTRNTIGIFITVNCAATVAKRISAHFDAARLAPYPNVDAVVAFVHEQGCGMEMTGEPMDLLRRTLSGYIRHPNIAGALVVSLGCERNNLARFFNETGLETSKLLKTITMQEVGGTQAAIRLGIEAVESMLTLANQAYRTPCSASYLKIGLQCGGSDGFSGLSANPALGKAVDLLVRHGGTAILSETPEIYGVEQTLTARAVTPEVGQQLLDRIQWWLAYSEGRDTQINGRVSPGNNAGGLANILEKSLGGAKKAGSTGLMAVYRYAEPVTVPGFVFMDTPGYDPVSATGQIAGGANLICFTTGRGSCFGSYPAPTLKLASNTRMYERMQDDMDINCGTVLDGLQTMDELGLSIFKLILDTASGTASKSEKMEVGEEEFCPWPIGVLG